MKQTIIIFFIKGIILKSLNISQLVTVFLLVFIPSVLHASSELQKENNYTAGPEDVLEIRVLGQQELQRTVEVSQNGTISLPLIGEVVAYGRTLFELENLIAKKLAEDKFLINAQVSIEVKRYGSLKVYILGEIKNPGRYFLKGRTHVFSLLAEAGGLTDDAGRKIVVIRGNVENNTDQTVDNVVFDIDMDDITTGKNMNSSFILPGDTLQVPKAPRFYVTGEVNKTGEFKWEKQLSVRRAIAMAGGPTSEGAPDRIRIQRFENDNEIEFHPQMTDMVEPKDIIIIPQSYF